MPVLPSENLEYVEAWGGASGALGYVFRPSTVAGLERVFQLARSSGLSVALRGAGRSYGDAAYNAEQIVADLSRMNRILDWDPDTGIIRVEPGVTIAQLWRYALGDGWWPAVVPGTMHPTLGGCAAMNIHGKNNWQAGPIGDHILSFTALLPTGEQVHCSREENSDLFHAMIGGLGLLGCFTSLTLQLKRIYSGRLRVRAQVCRNFDDMLAQIDRAKDACDYAVGWVDCLAVGRRLGRGQIHLASYLDPGEDPAAPASLQLGSQDLPDTFFGVVPRSLMPDLMRPFINDIGVRWVNRARYHMSRLHDGHEFEQPLAQFSFLLDYIPGWKRAYRPEGLIQYQAFLPSSTAADGFRALLQTTQDAGLPSYLGVLKRHRPDAFLLSHAVDGFSLALDFRVTRYRRERLRKLSPQLDEIVLQSGGRFYFAKDSTLRPEAARAFLGRSTLERLRTLKDRCDPEGLLETNLIRRVLPELARGEGRGARFDSSIAAEASRAAN